MLDLMETRLAADPDGHYLDVAGTEYSAAEVRDVATRVAVGLVALGVRSGDRVATLMENRPETMLAWWGIVHAGAVAVPVNSAYKGTYLRHQLADSGSRALIVEADFLSRATEVLPDLPDLSTLVVVGGSATAATRGSSPGVVVTWDDLTLAGPPGCVPQCGPRTWPRSSTPGEPPGRRRAACSATPTMPL